MLVVLICRVSEVGFGKLLLLILMRLEMDLTRFVEGITIDEGHSFGQLF